tara:strand:- start:280 stop:498 length:219 start_codon:yes stop_codon:yes gene_type:complete
MFKKNKSFRGDLVPYIDFIEFFRTRIGWEEHITDPNSPFMRLLQLDDLFMTRKVISKQNGTGFTDDVKEKAK